MIVHVRGAPVFVATGGRDFDPDDNVVLLIHGAGMNRTVWRYQSRYLAHHGHAVAAIDLPGHGRSGGPLLARISAMSEWLVELLDELGVSSAALVGHSMGTFVALEAAAVSPERVTRLALLATADAMPVHPELLSAADAKDHKAFDLVTSWSLGRTAQLGGHPEPGAWMTGGTLSIFEEEKPGVLANDLHAANDYSMAAASAARIKSPVLVMIGRDDRMTPPRATLRLVANFTDVETLELRTGHIMMSEDPIGVVRGLAGFLGQ